MLPLEYEQESSPWAAFNPEKFHFTSDWTKAKPPA